jgi:hypothetical protein
MATTFTRNGQPITTDFLFGEGAGAVQVPFENLLVWNDAELATYGVTKVVTVDVPAVISDRQFFQQLAVAQIITEAEALAAVRTGAIPSLLAAFIATLPQADRFAAEMVLSGATDFLRVHPLTDAIGASQGMTPAQVDAFFIAAAQI